MKQQWRLPLVFCLSLLISLEYWPLYQSMEDEAVVVYGAQRILQGQMIYRDWDTHLAPGSFYLSAAWFALLGFQAPATRLLFSVIVSVTAVLVDMISQRCLPGRWQWLPLLLWCSAGVMEFPILSYHWMATTAVTATLLLGLDWIKSQTRLAALGLGASIALAAWFLQSEGLAATLMFLWWWLRFRPRHGAYVLLSMLVISCLLWLPVVSQWPVIIQQNTHLGGHLAFNRKLYSWSHWCFFLSHYQGLSLQAGWTTCMAIASHVVINALRYLGLPWLILLAWYSSERKKDSQGIALAGALLAWFVATANRHTIVYLSFLSPGWALLLAKVLQLMPRGFYLAIGLSIWEVCGWACRFSLRQQSFIFPIQTRAGIYYVSDAASAAVLNETFAWIRDLPPETPVLCFPYAPSLYTLGRLKNPIRRQTLVPGLEPQWAFHKSLLEIEQARTPWLIYRGPNGNEIAGEYNISSEQVSRDWESLRGQMTAGYQLVAGSLQCGLYRRRQI